MIPPVLTIDLRVENEPPISDWQSAIKAFTIHT
jgi:hypothetical protein